MNGSAHMLGVVLAPAGIFSDLFGDTVGGALKSMVSWFFAELADLFLPSWLTHAPANLVRWLVTLPDTADPSQWPTMSALEQDVSWCAYPFVGLTVLWPMLRSLAPSALGPGVHPAEGVGKAFVAMLGLKAWPTVFSQAINLVNQLTLGLLSFNDIGHGLDRATGALFGVSFVAGGPETVGALTAVLVIVAVFMAAILVLIKAGIMYVYSVIFVAGPLAIGVSGLPGGRRFFDILIGLFLAVALVPVCWCITFAVASAFAADISHLSTPAAIGDRTVGFFAALIAFGVSVAMPFFLYSHVKPHVRSAVTGAASVAGRVPGAERVSGAASRAATGFGAAARTASGAGGAMLGAAGVSMGSPGAAAARAAGPMFGKAATIPFGGSAAAQAVAGNVRGGWEKATQSAAAQKLAQTPVVGSAARGAGRAATVAAAVPGAVAKSFRKGDAAAGDQHLAHARQRATAGRVVTPEPGTPRGQDTGRTHGPPHNPADKGAAQQQTGSGRQQTRPGASASQPPAGRDPSVAAGTPTGTKPRAGAPGPRGTAAPGSANHPPATPASAPRAPQRPVADGDAATAASREQHAKDPRTRSDGPTRADRGPRSDPPTPSRS